ncbi:hypothetical protein [Benzoatithermus flavus]|uniref:Uncharacterized protein n=1 Tax=Benzoatithermus flavus TaxID=3108223 RepID=A0ABU8XTF9_9PROT
MKVIWIVRRRRLEEACTSLQEAIDCWEQEACDIAAEPLEVAAGRQRKRATAGQPAPGHGILQPA